MIAACPATTTAIDVARTATQAPAAAPSPAAGPRFAAPTVVLSEPAVAGMPAGPKQEIRVLAATFAPGAQTVFHRHRWPVTVYVLEGHFTLEVDGRAPLVVGPGQAFVEEPGLAHTGHNHDPEHALRVVIFSVCEPGAPFLELAG